MHQLPSDSTPSRQFAVFVAEQLARAIEACPSLEVPFRKMSAALRGNRIWSGLQRRIVQSLGRRWSAANNDIRTLTVEGFHLDLNVLLECTRDAFFKGLFYEPKTVAFLVEHLKPGEVFVDIGANVGYFSTLAGKCVGSTGKVYSFEPNPLMQKDFNRHVVLNNLSRIVTIIPMALLDRDTEALPLRYPVDSFIAGRASIMPPSHSGPSLNSPGWSTVTVRGARMDSWLPSQGLHQVDVVKIDVEGAEDLVMGGMSETLIHCPPRVFIIETTPQSLAYRTLVKHGYRVVDLDDVGGGVQNYGFLKSQHG